MDDIYGDLENYDEVNVIEELRNENKELKMKLKDHALRMEKLQQDFDKVSKEFRYLEMNYSSLLKTARAEIERKTKIITDLNIEKDKLVLHSLKNGKRYVKNIRSFNPHYNLDVGGNRKSNFYERKGMKSEQSIDYASQHKNQGKQRMSEESSKKSSSTQNEPKENYKTNKEDFKENERKEISKNYDNETNSERRKSVYHSESQKHAQEPPKFSSDEDGEILPYGEATHQNNDKKYKNRDFDYKVSRVSENFDDRIYRPQFTPNDYNYYDRRKPRQCDSEVNFTSKEKFLSKHRYDRNLSSPEKTSRRSYKSSSNSRYDRRKSSPPPGDLHKSKQHSKDENFSRKNVLDRLHRHGSQNNKHRFTGDNIDNIEPEKKRRKVVREEQAAKKHSNSCQSPDHVENDAFQSQPVIEIIATAESNLQDPREKSSKYEVINIGETTRLSTVSSRNIDLKYLDWKKNMPKALLKKPPQYYDDFINEVYMNQENVTRSDEQLDSQFNEDCSVDTSCMKINYKIREKKIKSKKEKIIKTEENVERNRTGILELKDNECNNVKENNASSQDTEITPLIKSNEKTQTQDSKCDVTNVKTRNSEYFVRRDLVEGDLVLSEDTGDSFEHNIKVTQKKNKKENLKKKPRKDKGSKKSNNIDKKINTVSCDKPVDIGSTKSKFSELFGDTTSSLITPEDLKLDISKNIRLNCKLPPDLEDMQDAMDLSLNEILCVQTSKSLVANTGPEIDQNENINNRDLTPDTLKEVDSFREEKPFELSNQSSIETVTKVITYSCGLECDTGKKSQIDDSNISKHLELLNKSSNNKTETKDITNDLDLGHDEVKKLYSTDSCTSEIKVSKHFELPKQSSNEILTKEVTLAISETNNKDVVLKPKIVPDYNLNVVKTLIMSTGFQPHCNLQIPEGKTTESENYILNKNNTQGIDHTNIHAALATSTPYKIPTLPKDIEINSNSNIAEDTISDSSNNAHVSNGSDVQEPNATSANAVTEDLPDVRIMFLKRRRKLIKK